MGVHGHTHQSRLLSGRPLRAANCLRPSLLARPHPVNLHWVLGPATALHRAASFRGLVSQPHSVQSIQVAHDLGSAVTGHTSSTHRPLAARGEKRSRSSPLAALRVELPLDDSQEHARAPVALMIRSRWDGATRQPVSAFVLRLARHHPLARRRAATALPLPLAPLPRLSYLRHSPLLWRLKHLLTWAPRSAPAGTGHHAGCQSSSRFSLGRHLPSHVARPPHGRDRLRPRRARHSGVRADSSESPASPRFFPGAFRGQKPEAPPYPPPEAFRCSATSLGTSSGKGSSCATALGPSHG